MHECFGRVLDEMDMNGRHASDMEEGGSDGVVDALMGDGERTGGDVHGSSLGVLGVPREVSVDVYELDGQGRFASAMEEGGVIGDVDALMGETQVGGAASIQSARLCFSRRSDGKGGMVAGGCGILPSPSAGHCLGDGSFLAISEVPSAVSFMHAQDARGKAYAGFQQKLGGLGCGNAWHSPLVMALPSVAELGVFSTDGSTALLDSDEVAATSSRFQDTLVGRLFGRRIPFHILSGELHRRWVAFGKFKIVTISRGCFIYMFDSMEAMDAVMLSGPWIVFGQVLGIDWWSPSFSLSSTAGFFTPVWVCLPELPLYCWSPKNFARIVALPEEPMWLDAAMAQFERGAYARICVRVDLSKAVQPGVWVDGPHGRFYQPIVYEGLSVLC